MVAIVVLVILGTALVYVPAWWNYRKLTQVSQTHDAEAVHSVYQAGMKLPVPGSSQLFWWFSTKYVNTEMSKVANEGIESEAVELFAETYRAIPAFVEEIIVPKSINAVEQYKNLLLEQQVAGAYLEIGLIVRPKSEDLLESKEIFDILSASRTAFAAAKKAEEQPYGAEEAANLYELVAEIDAENFAIAKELIPELRLKANEEMQTWASAVKHFTLNPLLAFPHMAPFDYANDYITTLEFKRILEQLEKNDYILVGLETLFTVSEDGKTIAPVALRVPKGKTPFVLSIENLSYATRHAKRGMVDKLIVEDDVIGTWTAAGHAGVANDVVSFDNDIIPILDAFIEKHPEFSWKGARATISISGYGGIFGYRTFGGENQAEEAAEAKKIADLLKKNGYTFASQGYEYFQMSLLTAEEVADDANNWTDYTATIVGKTPLFFWPFGDALPQDSDGAAELRRLGYRSFSLLGPNSFVEYTEEVRIDERAFLDGFKLNYRPGQYEGYFDVATVFDTEGRDQMSYWLDAWW
jgi:hypothetical protein